MMMSLLPDSKEEVARSLNLSISSLIERSFFNVGIVVGNVGFGLVIIVVRNKIFYRIFRKNSVNSA